MKVHELVKMLLEQDPDAVVVIERDDEYWQISDVDGAVLVNPGAKNPVWDYDYCAEDEADMVNAVRICM